MRSQKFPLRCPATAHVYALCLRESGPRVEIVDGKIVLKESSLVRRFLPPIPIPIPISISIPIPMLLPLPCHCALLPPPSVTFSVSSRWQGRPERDREGARLPRASPAAAGQITRRRTRSRTRTTWRRWRKACTPLAGDYHPHPLLLSLRRGHIHTYIHTYIGTRPSASAPAEAADGPMKRPSSSTWRGSFCNASFIHTYIHTE